PRDPQHAGRFGTIYFGVLPTGSDETEDGGRARFDDQHLYEGSVFSKRHTKSHARGQACKCPEKTLWSQPTEVYKLASHFDLDGTAHRPVTVQMPDLNVLAAQAKPVLGMALAKPKDSLTVSGDQDGKISSHGRSGMIEICMFALPVIMIVASFLF